MNLSAVLNQILFALLLVSLEATFPLTNIGSKNLPVSLLAQNNRASHHSASRSKAQSRSRSTKSRNSSKKPSSKSSSKASRKSVNKTPKSVTLARGENITIGDFVYVNMPINQWTEFYFGEVGQLPYSRWNFNVPENQKCTLQVVDGYCAGDQFVVVKYNPKNGKEKTLLQTPPVPYNPIIAQEIQSGQPNVTCNPFTTDPAEAWASNSWSKGEVSLKGGQYYIIIKPTLAPYGSGGAYVRVKCQNHQGPAIFPATKNIADPADVCTIGASGIKYLNQPYTFSMQEAACQSIGSHALNIDLDNLNDAIEVLYKCGGKGSKAWIATYNHENYRSDIGLSLNVGESVENTYITSSFDLSIAQPVLCQ